MPARKSRDIYEFFERVRQRPGMYFRRKSLRELETMCHGYASALHNHKIQEPGVGFSAAFNDYLYKRFGWSTCQGWARAIQDHSRNSSQAFDRFFVLLDEFKNANEAWNHPHEETFRF